MSTHPIPIRQIYSHRTPSAQFDLNSAINVTAVGELSKGGAAFEYRIEPISTAIEPTGPINPVTLVFQNRPIQSPVDVMGLSNESLVAVVADRMEGFQNGPFACLENAHALYHLQSALMWLQKRSRDRAVRGVLGSYKP